MHLNESKRRKLSILTWGLCLITNWIACFESLASFTTHEGYAAAVLDAVLMASISMLTRSIYLLITKTHWKWLIAPLMIPLLSLTFDNICRRVPHILFGI